MLLWYAANALLDHLDASGPALATLLKSLDAAASAGREALWENLGGQLVPLRKLDALLDRVREGELHNWVDMHAQYAVLADEYALDKAQHAWALLLWLRGPDLPLESPTDRPIELLRGALADLCAMSERVESQVFLTRAKDYSNKFRKATFRGEAEMRAVVGCPEDNAFVQKTRKDMASLRERSRLLLGLVEAL